MSLRDLLFQPEAALGLDPEAFAVHAGDEVCTWAELRDRAGDVACALADAGVRAGHPVGVMLPNGIDLIAGLFGVWRADAVSVPLNPRLTDPEVDRILATVPPAAVVTTAEHVARFAGPPVLVPDTRGTRRAIGPNAAGPDALAAAGRPDAATDAAGVDGEARSTSVADTGDRPSWRLARTGEPGVVRTGFDSGVALVQFTSGTTGAPKPVLLDHDGVLRLLDGVVAKLRGGARRLSEGASPPGGGVGAERGPEPAGDRRPPMPNLIPVSLSLWAGIYNVLFAFRVGAPVVVMDGFDAVEFAGLVARHGIRSTVLPPASMTALVDDERIGDLAPLRLVRSITAPLSPLQARRFKDRFGIAVLNSYGQTEIGGEIVGWNAADARHHGEAKLGSVGRPHAGVVLRIVGHPGGAADPAGSGEAGSSAGGAQPKPSPGGAVDAAVGEAGELWVRTPAMAAGYADGTDLGDRVTADGWFRTGDIARVDTDGFLWIEGRVSDMVNRGGLKVHPGEVEEVLRLAPGVADAAVVGVPDDRLGEVPWAFVVPAAGVTGAGTGLDPDDLATLCREHLAPYKIPVRFQTIDALPRNEVGKVLKRDLASQAATR